MFRRLAPRTLLKNLKPRKIANPEEGIDFAHVSYTERHTISILYKYDYLRTKLVSPTSLLPSGHVPLDVLTSKYMRKHNIGTNNRHFISQLIFDISRWLLFVNFQTMHTQKFTSMRNDLKQCANKWITYTPEKGPVGLVKAVVNKRGVEKEYPLTRTKKQLQLDEEIHEIWNKDNKIELIEWRTRYQAFRSMEKEIQAMVENQLANPDMEYEDDTIPTNIRYSCPLELYDMLVKDLGKQQAHRLCAINNTQAPTYGRLNPLKLGDLTRKQVISALQKRYKIEVSPTKLSPLGLRFAKRYNFNTFEEFKSGWFEVQDEGSQLVSSMVEAKPGQLVLDYCAGSGGKSLAIAPNLVSEGKPSGCIFVSDVYDWKLLEAKKRLKRAGITFAQPLLQTHPEMKKLKGRMDWVLVDVPCSGTGTIRRNPELKYRVNQGWLDSLVQLQRKIFVEGVTFMKDSEDSRLVYSTCSVLKCENEQQVDFLLKHFGGQLELVKMEQRIPQLNGMDGYFAAIFKLQ